MVSNKTRFTRKWFKFCLKQVSKTNIFFIYTNFVNSTISNFWEKTLKRNWVTIGKGKNHIIVKLIALSLHSISGRNLIIYWTILLGWLEGFLKQ